MGETPCSSLRRPAVGVAGGDRIDGTHVLLVGDRRRLDSLATLLPWLPRQDVRVVAEAGADAYLPTPFAAEAWACLLALRRRYRSSTRRGMLSLGRIHGARGTISGSTTRKGRHQ